MTISLYTVCWNEADLVPFFFRHYDSWVDRYVIFDDGSDDGSRELLLANPKVEVRRFLRTSPESFVLSHTALQNSVWKESRGRDAWVVITAIDEHLTVPRRPMRDYLAAQKREGVTYIPARGFNMISDALPAGNRRLVDLIRHGAPSAGFNKLSIFDPDAIIDTGFATGRHTAQPAGRLVAPQSPELLLLHFKYLGFQRTFERHRAEGARLGRLDIEKSYGRHYLFSEEQFRAKWDSVRSAAFDVWTHLEAMPASEDPAPEPSPGPPRRLIDRLRRLRFGRIRPGQTV